MTIILEYIKDHELFQKSISVLKSCKNKDQKIVAEKYVELAISKIQKELNITGFESLIKHNIQKN